MEKSDIMSVTIYRVEYKGLSWGRDFADWLMKQFDDGRGKYVTIRSEEFKEKLANTTEKFRKKNQKQIWHMQACLKKLDMFDVCVSD